MQRFFVLLIATLLLNSCYLQYHSGAKIQYNGSLHGPIQPSKIIFLTHKSTKQEDVNTWIPLDLLPDQKDLADSIAKSANNQESVFENGKLQLVHIEKDSSWKNIEKRNLVIVKMSDEIERSGLLFFTLLTLGVLPGYYDEYYRISIVYYDKNSNSIESPFFRGPRRTIWLSWLLLVWGPTFSPNIDEGRDLILDSVNDLLRIYEPLVSDIR